MTTTEHYPVGLTVDELRQRAWIEGDLRTAALLAAGAGPTAVSPVDEQRGSGARSVQFQLAVQGQLPLELLR